MSAKKTPDKPDEIADLDIDLPTFQARCRLLEPDIDEQLAKLGETWEEYFSVLKSLYNPDGTRVAHHPALTPEGRALQQHYKNKLTKLTQMN